MSPPAVVDTNVLLVANRAHAHATKECIARCAAELQRFHKNERRLILDSAREILGEYHHKLDPRRQGVGDAFLKWVLTNLANASRVELVPLTACDGSRRYEQFPSHPALADFDRDDRKFVAVACAHEEKPPILEASDAKWIGWNDALAEKGVRVEFLCEEDLKATFAKKFPEKQPRSAKNKPRQRK